ncbi:MAG: chitobiase/beta-hexosaminidase C-terminal domain-containing protein [Bacteroidales bacterium]|nr:chitobiase/beta-hexosaminidase C-terminal domain-containing protein [Bacteroidales bacterium]
MTEGTYNGPKHVTITAPDGYTEGIAYTTDESDPTTSDINYTSAGIDITTTTTLRAVAYDSKGNSSGEATATYTITYNAPTFSHATGTYYGDQSVSISVADLGSGSILYTTNGNDPKTNGTEYTEAISLPVGTNLTLKAVAKYGEELFSEVTEATYDIQKISPSFYQRVTSTDELTENSSYLIVCKSENVAFGEISNSKGSPQHVTITGDKIDLSADGTGIPIEFTLESNESGYLLKNSTTGKYIVFSDNGGTAVTETTVVTALNISFESDGSAKINNSNSTTRQILYHTKDKSSTYYVFGNYASSNIGEEGYATVYLYKKHVVKEFSDAEDLTASLPGTALADQTVILDRKVYSGWNTFCVPFALTQTQLEEAYGSGAVAKYLSNVTTGAEGVTLHFTPEAEGGIKANKAYLLYLTADVKEAKTFSGVTLEPAGKCTTTVKTAEGDYTFQGILAPTTLATNDTQYFLNSTGTAFVLPRADSSPMKATRAYIIVPTPAGSAQGRQYRFDFNGTTTAIDNVTVSGMEDGAWHTISGIRINRPAAKGVYIHNGRKVIVK